MIDPVRRAVRFLRALQRRLGNDAASRFLLTADRARLAPHDQALLEEAEEALEGLTVSERERAEAILGQVDGPASSDELAALAVETAPAWVGLNPVGGGMGDVE